MSFNRIDSEDYYIISFDGTIKNKYIYITYYLNYRKSINVDNYTNTYGDTSYLEYLNKYNKNYITMKKFKYLCHENVYCIL